VVVLVCFPRQESCALIRYGPPKLGHCACALNDLGRAAGLARSCLQSTLPQSVLDDLVGTRLSSLLNCVRLVTAQLDIAKMQQVAEIGTSFGCGLECGCGCGCLLGLFTCLLAFNVKRAEKRVGLGLRSVAEVAVKVAKGVGARKIGVRDADTGELEEAFEELGGSGMQETENHTSDLQRT
jgi:Zn-dependent alcohol dehydrogenase